MMKLSYYLNKFKIDAKIKDDHEISLITDHSKQVIKNSIYFYIIDKDKTFIDEAIRNGAKTIILSNDIDFDYNNINIVKVSNPKYIMSLFLKESYLLKYNQLPIIIGVTGTTGKTTTSSLIYQSLKRLKYDVLLFSSNGNISYYACCEKKYKTINTTPSLSTIYELMMKNELSYDYVVIEVSSQGFCEGRILNIEFDYMIFTNFSCEHLEYHKTYEKYRSAKLDILKQVKKFIIMPFDFNESKYFLNNLDKMIITYGTSNSDYTIDILSDEINESLFIISNKNKNTLFKSKIIGRFNIYNLTSVYILLNEILVENNKINDVICSLKDVDGRMNVFNMNNNYIIVDYAHSLVAIEYLLEYLKNKKHNRIISIIGSGGNRYKERRRKIGDLVTKICDFTIFTEDNSRDENVEDIIKDMLYEVKTNNFIIKYNRKKAIDFGISLLEKDDILVIIGKGNEDYIERKDKIMFNDLKYVKSYLDNIYE